MGQFQSPITIKEAIDKIDSNRYLIPAFQREFVWSKEQIENLFDSLMRGYPISSMLFWEVKHESRNAYQFYQFLQEYVEEHKIHNEPKAGCETMESFYAILDGQQRLTSLFLGLKGTVAYHAKYKPWENEDTNFPPMKLYLNLSKTLKQEEGTKVYDFQFLPKNDGWDDIRIINDEKWFKVGSILGIERLMTFCMKHHLEEEECCILENLKKVICTETVINYYLETDVAADKAVDIFVRINSGGKPLSIPDILMSIVIAGWKDKDARKEFKNLQELVSNRGFKISNDYIIKSLQYLLDKPVQSKITTFNDIFVAETEESWNGVKEAITSLFSLLRSFGLTDMTLTSYNATMPILYYLYKNEIYAGFDSKIQFETERSNIKQWLMKTLLLKSFGGSSDSTLEQARKSFEPEKLLPFPGTAISKNIKQHIAPSEIDEILSTQKEQTYAFPILALFYPNLNLSNKFNLDHMHPMSSFKTYFNKYSVLKDEKESKKRYNSIVNLQMLGENENKSKNDMSLSDWVAQIGKDRATLKRETYLPDSTDLSLDNFDEFYKERKNLLKSKLCEILGLSDDSQKGQTEQGEQITTVYCGDSFNGSDIISKEMGMKIAEKEGKPYDINEINSTPEEIAKQRVQDSMSELKEIGKGAPA